MFGDGAQAVLFHPLTLGSSQVRSENHPRAMFGCVFDCGYRGADAGVVFDVAVFDGNVEVNADEDALVAQVEIADGKLCHCRFSIADWHHCPTFLSSKTEPSHTVGLLPRFSISNWQS